MSRSEHLFNNRRPYFELTAHAISCFLGIEVDVCDSTARHNGGEGDRGMVVCHIEEDRSTILSVHIIA